MTAITKAIFTEIKKHNDENEYLNQYNKGIKFKSIGRYHRDEFTICYDNASLVRYEFKCRFKPANKYDNNIVKYMVCIYSDGGMGIYFDGTEYEK